MKNRYSNPVNTKKFQHYAESFKLLKLVSSKFKWVTISLVTIGLLISLSIINFTPSGISYQSIYLLIASMFIISYFIYIIVHLNEIIAGSFVRYLFLIKKEKGWGNLPDILLHILKLAMVVTISYALFWIAHNTGDAIGASISKAGSNDGKGEVSTIERSDSLFDVKKLAINARFDTLLTQRQQTVNEQIKSANVTFSLIPRRQKSEKLQQQKKIDGLTAQKLEIQQKLDTEKEKELSAAATLYASTRTVRVNANADSLKSISEMSSKAIQAIKGFLGFDILVVVACACALQVIKQKSGIAPVYEIENGDFDESQFLEVIKKPFQIRWVKILNRSRRMEIPETLAPSVANAYFNPENITQEETTTSAKKVFTTR